jgi:GNAT superfamily N-acetyltransferase
MMELAEVPNEQISDAQIRDRDVTSSRCAYTRHFLATESGSEVGLLSIDLLPEEERFVIYEIFVPSSLRRRGVGARLLAAAEEMARDLGYKSALLLPKTMDEAFDQQALEEWYARKGYTLLEDSGNGAFVKQLG